MTTSCSRCHRRLATSPTSELSMCGVIERVLSMAHTVMLSSHLALLSLLAQWQQAAVTASGNWPPHQPPAAYSAVSLRGWSSWCSCDAIAHLLYFSSMTTSCSRYQPKLACSPISKFLGCDAIGDCCPLVMVLLLWLHRLFSLSAQCQSVAVAVSGDWPPHQPTNALCARSFP